METEARAKYLKLELTLAKMATEYIFFCSHNVRGEELQTVNAFIWLATYCTCYALHGASWMLMCLHLLEPELYRSAVQ